MSPDERPVAQAGSQFSTPLPRQAILILAFMLLLGVATLVDPEEAPSWAAVAMLVGMGSASLNIFRRTRGLRGRERAGWRLMGSGMAFAAMGLLVFALLETLVGPQPVVGPLDGFFVTSYLLLLSGLFVLPHAGGALTGRLLVWVDGFVGAISIAVLAWIWVLSDVVGSLAELPIVERFLGTAYPILDVTVLIVCTMMVVRRTAVRFDLRLLVLALGLLLQALADLSLLATTQGGTLADAQPAFPLFVAAAASFAFVGTVVDRAPAAKEYPDRQAPWWTLIAPYASAIVMVAVFIYEVRHPEPAYLELLAFSGTAVALATVLRQSVSIRENRIRVEEERREMVSSLSHELRTPLTSMVGFMELLEDGLVPEAERAELLGIVNDQIHYMSRIVCDLVLLAREDPSAMNLRPERLNVATAVSAAVRAAAATHGEVPIRADRGLVAKVDAERFQQVLSNLITNAGTYGGGDIEIRAEADHRDLVIEVHDNGPGVPPKYQLTIWDRFERGVNKFNANIPGSGIGLAVVSAIARAHGGDAGYRPSERLGGACFTVRFAGAVVTSGGGRSHHGRDACQPLQPATGSSIAS